MFIGNAIRRVEKKTQNVFHAKKQNKKTENVDSVKNYAQRQTHNSIDSNLLKMKSKQNPKPERTQERTR